MKRRPEELAREPFDVVVVGGGMLGAACALDAAQRGLKVALLERGDFCGATSANSFKMVHGGIRYLQHGDLSRLRRSARARRAFLKIAPHLVRPLPILVPTYGRFGLKGKPALRVAMALYDALTPDRNHGISDPTRRIPAGKFLSASTFKRLHPTLATEALTGAGVYHDGQFVNPQRLVLAFIRSAAALGAIAVNHASAVDLRFEGDRITGVRVVDHITGRSWDLRTRWVINAAGPYAERLLKSSLDLDLEPPGVYSRDAWFLVDRPLIGEHQAIAVPARSRDGDALASRGTRHLFLVPWRGATLIGVWHKIYKGPPDDYVIADRELEEWLGEVNDAYPGLGLSPADVSLAMAGLVPFDDAESDGSTLKFAHRSKFVDHAEADAIDGLTTVIAARLTSAVPDAVDVIDRVQKRLQGRTSVSVLERSPLHGGSFETFEAVLAEAAHEAPPSLPPHVIEALVVNHGSAYREIFDLIRECPNGAQLLPRSHVPEAEVIHAIRSEMAMTLADVVFRRSDLCATAAPAGAALDRTAQIMAGELGWDRTRTASEHDGVAQRLATPLSGRVMLEQIAT